MGAAPGRKRDEEGGVACGDEASRERLRLAFAVGDHVVAPADGGEILGVVPNPASATASRVSKTGANVGLVGDERGRLEGADPIGFAQRGHWRQRRVERSRSLRIEAASV